ncbi:MAG: hypothetical protein U0791_15935 [Gemmataceae bacterium]
MLIVLGVLLVAGVVVAGLHAVQTDATPRARRTTRSNLAEGAKDPEKVDEAIKLLDMYLKMEPGDESTYRRFAEVNFDRAKQDPRYDQPATEAAERFLRLYPENPPERKKLIDLYLKAGKVQSARQHIQMLFERGREYRDDVDLLDKAAVCEEALNGDIAQAVKYLDDAIQTKKAPPRIVQRMLELLDKTKAFNDPRFTPSKYVGILVSDEPYRGDVEARVLAGRYLLKSGDTVNARRHITDSLTMPGGATNAEALMAAAELERNDIKSAETVLPQLKKARIHLEAAFNLDKKNVRAGLMLAENLTDLGEPKAAVDVLRQSAEALGDDSPDLQNMLVDRLLDLDERELSARLIEKIAKNEIDRDRIVKYFRGRTEILKKNWSAARPLLEEVAPVLVRVPLFHKKAMAGLGQCYAAIQNPDKELESFLASHRDDPYYLPARIGMADAYLKLGKFPEALAEYKAIVNGYGMNAFRPQYARLEFRAAVRQPAASRNWDAFEVALGKEADRTPELNVMYAESLMARTPPDLDKARLLLEGAIAKEPRNANAWLALARLVGRGNAPDADKFLDKMAEKLGDAVEVRLARAVTLVSRARKPVAADFRKLAAGADKFDKAEQRRLLLGLGEGASRAAALADDAEAKVLRDVAIEYFRGAAELDPNDLITRSAIIDLAILADRKDLIEPVLAEIAKIEGEKGPIGTLTRVILKLPEVRKIGDKAARAAAIADLRSQAGVAQKSRPGWGRVSVVLAQLDDLEGLSDSALKNYKDAIDKGERQEFVVRRAVDLYRERRQDDLAALLLNALYTEMNLPDDLERFRAIKDLLARDIPKSERPVIERIAPADSKDWRILLLRGSLLAAIGADDDALAALRAAVALGDNVPETWGALVGHLVRVGRLDDAKRATLQAEGATPPKTDSGKADLLIVIAGCHELTGDVKKAEEKFREAVKAAPHELNPNRQLLLFLQRRGSLAEADAMLRRFTDDPAQDLARWARRHLALTLMGRRDAYNQRHIALQLIDRNTAISKNDPEDVKARAVVQTIDPTTRDEGIKTLKDYAKFGDLTPDEFLLLGRIHFEQGKVFESVDFFEKAARPRAGLTIEHLAGLVRVYVGIGKLGQARAAAERLKAFAPRSWEAVREEARVLQAESLDAEKRGNAEEKKKLADQALALIITFPNALTESSIRSRTGPLLEELGFASEAETYYTRLLTDAKDPNPHFPLASFLIRQKRSAEAIALAKKYEATTPPALTARILTGAIRVKSPGAAAERDVASWLETRLKEPKNTLERLALLTSRAELYEGIGDYDKAIAGYQDALVLAKTAKAEEIADFAPELIANNLAMILVLHRPQDAEKAIKMMDEVIAIRGPAPVFLDTRAVAYILKGDKTDQAANDLQLALIQQKKAAYLFHLAWAYDLDPNKRSQRELTLEEARKLGITPEDLHPMEHLKFNQLFNKK